MPELLNARDIARVLQCNPTLVRHRMREGEWKIGRVIRPGPGQTQCKYEATIGEVAKYFDLDREEVERRLQESRKGRDKREE